MGGGQSNLSPEDSAILTGLLKDEYAILQREGYTEAIIQEKLAQKYNEIIQSMAIKASPPGTRQGARPGRPRSADSEGGNDDGYADNEEEDRDGQRSGSPLPQNANP